MLPGALKSLPGVREQLLSQRVGDTCETSFRTRWHERCILFKDDGCEIDLSLYRDARLPSPSPRLAMIQSSRRDLNQSRARVTREAGLAFSRIRESRASITCAGRMMERSPRGDASCRVFSDHISGWLRELAIERPLEILMILSSARTSRGIYNFYRNECFLKRMFAEPDASLISRGVPVSFSSWRGVFRCGNVHQLLRKVPNRVWVRRYCSFDPLRRKKRVGRQAEIRFHARCSRILSYRR